MLRRTVSFEDLETRANEPSAPVYRNPDRDLMSDEQSLLDRLSLDNQPKLQRQNNQFEPAPSYSQQVPATREITATIVNGEEPFMKFDGTCTIPVKDWLFRFEYKNNIKNLSEDTKKNKLIRSLGGDAENYIFRALKDDPEISYEDLKKTLIEGFTSQYEPTVCFYKLVDKNWKKGDTLFTYWNDKLSLMEKCDPNFSFTTKKNLLIMGLPRGLRQMVNAQILVCKPTTLNNLYQMIEALYIVMADGEEKAQKLKQNMANNVKPFMKVEKQNYDNTNKKQYQQGNRGYNRPNYQNQRNNNYRRDQYQNRNKNDNQNQNQNQRPRNNQQFKQNFQWSEDGRPICNQCKQSGHMMRECPKNEQNQEN